MDIDLFNTKKNLKNSVNKILVKYPGKVPLYVTKSPNDKILNEISNNKFIVPESITVSQFLTIIRKRIDLSPEMSLFVFINNTLPLQSSTIGKLYYEYKNKDGLLELQYCGENTFGHK